MASTIGPISQALTFTTLPLHFQPVGWFGLDLNSSNQIGAWTSRVNGHVVTESVNKPTLFSYNGIRGLFFSGALSQKLIGAPGIAAAIDESAEFTVYSISTLTQPPNAIRSIWTVSSFISGGGTIFNNIKGGTGSTGVLRIARQTTAVPSDAMSSDGPIITGSIAKVITIMYKTGSMHAWVDGVMVITGAVQPRSPVCDTFAISGRLSTQGTFDNFWNGMIGDVIIYTSSHDVATREKIENWYREKYAL
jgi:hypothetical protein